MTPARAIPIARFGGLRAKGRTNRADQGLFRSFERKLQGFSSSLE